LQSLQFCRQGVCIVIEINISKYCLFLKNLIDTKVLNIPQGYSNKAKLQKKLICNLHGWKTLKTNNILVQIKTAVKQLLGVRKNTFFIKQIVKILILFINYEFLDRATTFNSCPLLLTALQLKVFKNSLVNQDLRSESKTPLDTPSVCWHKSLIVMYFVITVVQKQFLKISQQLVNSI